MGNKIPEDMVYTITTGFYPQLFSGNTKWKGGFYNKGRKGMQWKSQKGWSKGTLKEIGGKKIDKGSYSSFLRSMAPLTTQGKENTKRKSWSQAAAKHLTPDEAEAAFQRGREEGMVSEAEMQDNLTYYKFMGNNEQYKLWGTKVWWQEGQRKKPAEMEKDINEWSFKEYSNNTKKLSTHLEQMYSNKEGELIDLAVELADKVFGKAIDEDNLRTDLETVGKEAEVPEEERKEAGEGGGEKVNSMSEKLSKISRARGLDIKYRMEDGTALYLDSTEMPLHQENQHGIVEQVEVDMRKAIESAKKMEKGWKGDLLKSVTTMFSHNISIYNPIISKMMGGPQKEKGDAKKEFMKIMGKITQANKKNKDRPDPRATVAELTGHLAVEKGQENVQDTARKYVVHTVMNLMGNANKNYRQGHLVGNIGGQNTYASVAMQLTEASGVPQFDEAFMKANTEILQGETHFLAIQQKDRQLKAGVTAETQARQMQAFMQGKITGVTASGQRHSQANAQLNVRQNVRQSTTVTFAPKALGKMLDKIPDMVGDNVNKNHMTKTASAFMANKSKNKLAQYRSVKFWAMPYLGLMEYPKKTEE